MINDMNVAGHNLSKLFLITIVGVLLSAFLFYKGLEEENASQTVNASADPSFSADLFGGGAATSALPVPTPEVPTQKEATPSSTVDEKSLVTVTKVIDGDTIEVLVDGKKESVRFIGIDTPETVDPRRPVGCFGREASDATKSLLTNKKVLLVKDVSDRDKYDRLLRYVYLPMESNQLLFVNDYLVRAGFAHVLTYPPDVKFNDQFLKAEEAARSGKKGLWEKC